MRVVVLHPSGSVTLDTEVPELTLPELSVNQVLELQYKMMTAGHHMSVRHTGPDCLTLRITLYCSWDRKQFASLVGVISNFFASLQPTAAS